MIKNRVTPYYNSNVTPNVSISSYNTPLTMGTTTKVYQEYFNGLLADVKIAIVGSLDIPRGSMLLSASAGGITSAGGINLNINFGVLNLVAPYGNSNFSPYISVFDDDNKTYVITWTPPSPIPIAGELGLTLTMPTALLDPTISTVYLGYVIGGYRNLGDILKKANE